MHCMLFREQILSFQSRSLCIVAQSFQLQVDLSYGRIHTPYFFLIQVQWALFTTNFFFVLKKGFTLK